MGVICILSCERRKMNGSDCIKSDPMANGSWFRSIYLVRCYIGFHVLALPNDTRCRGVLETVVDRPQRNVQSADIEQWWRIIAIIIYTRSW